MGIYYDISVPTRMKSHQKSFQGDFPACLLTGGQRRSAQPLRVAMRIFHTQRKKLQRCSHVPGVMAAALPYPDVKFTKIPPIFLPLSSDTSESQGWVNSTATIAIPPVGLVLGSAHPAAPRGQEFGFDGGSKAGLDNPVGAVGFPYLGIPNGWFF